MPAVESAGIDGGVGDGETAFAADAKQRVQAQPVIGFYIEYELPRPIGRVSRIGGVVIVVVPRTQWLFFRNTRRLCFRGDPPRRLAAGLQDTCSLFVLNRILREQPRTGAKRRPRGATIKRGRTAVFVAF
jgi:hypothetical protein